MPTYISLCRWTQKGIEKAKDSPKRLEQARKAFKAKGCEIKEFYLTIGQYDFVVLGEAPNDQAFAEAMMTVAAGGAVRSETMRAFNEAEYKKIVSSLP